MAYHHGGFTYAEQQHVPVNMLFQSHSQPQFPAYAQPGYVPQPLYSQYGYPDHLEFGSVAMVGDEWDDPNEITTRPRLTKEQVDVLESQFQEHPKPNSLQKRQLAMQTKLSLPRVAVSHGPCSASYMTDVTRIGSRTAEPRRSSKESRKNSKVGISKSHNGTPTRRRAPRKTVTAP